MQNKGLSLIGHLAELRKRIILCLAAFFLTAALSLPLIKPIISFLRSPARPYIDKFAFFSPQEIAFVYAKIALFCGLVISLPVILYQIVKFILPAIEEKLRQGVFRFVFFTLTAFIAGGIFGYYFLVPVSLKFLMSLGGVDLIPVISLDKYTSFILALVLGCGLVFEIPVLAWILTKLNMVSPRLLRQKRKYALAVILILAAIITPTTDPINM